MRQLLLCLPVLLTALPAQAQLATPPRRDSLATAYLHKSANQKTAGWLLLVGGAATATIATVRMAQLLSGPYSIFAAVDPDVERQLGTWSAVFAVGGGMALGSAPLFLAARRNSRRARAAPVVGLLLGVQPLAPTALGPVPAVPAVGLRLTL